MNKERIRLIRRSIFPSAVSVAIHAGMLLLAFGVTIHHFTPTERSLPLLEIDSTGRTHVQPVRPQTPAAPSTDAPHSNESSDTRATAPARIVDEALGAAEGFRTIPDLAPPAGWVSPVEPPPIARAPESPAASFAGLHASAAMRIVYVVDASGAMVHTLSFVLDELARSVNRLQPTQSFQIILLGDRPGHDPVRVAPLDTRDLARATPANRAAATSWLNSIIAGGRSNPIDGLSAALERRPDLVFVLARGIQRTATDATQDDTTDAVLRRLDTLNPPDPRTGLRPAVIKTIQFVDEDPTGLLQRIARDHGDGEGSIRLLKPDAVGDAPPTPTAEALPEPLEHAIARAAALITPVERDLSTLAALARVATEAEARSVHDASHAALETLADAPPATPRTHDTRAQLLRARAALLAASVEQSIPHRLDLANRAIADASPLPIVDPIASAERDISLALARSIAGRPDRAHDDLLSLITHREDSGINAPTLARARLALLSVADAIAPGSTQADRARHALAYSLNDEPSLWHDPAWRALASAMLAASLRDSGAPPHTALAPLLRPRLDPLTTPSQQRALFDPRIAVVARDITNPPPHALAAIARHEARLGRVDRAVALFERASADPDEMHEALRSAATLLLGRNAQGDKPRARALLLRYAESSPGQENLRHALTLAFDQPGSTPDQLAAALRLDPRHPLADQWRIQLAAALRARPGLTLLDERTSRSPEADILALEIVDELLGENPDEPTLLERGVELAQRLGDQSTDARRLALALAVLDSQPGISLETLAPISRPTLRDEADHIRLRALIALGRDTDAFATARALATRREPIADHVFWEAATIWLELGAARGGPEARAAAQAHVARLRLSHPQLGGEPWSTRLQRISQ